MTQDDMVVLKMRDTVEHVNMQLTAGIQRGVLNCSLSMTSNIVPILV